jgi:drug/metabolite transporter (DMT)-like permease
VVGVERGAEAKGAFWAAATALSYSLSAIVGKDLVGELGAASLLFWRFGIASAVLWPALMIWRRRGGPNPLDVPRRLAFSMGILWGAMTITGFLALEHIDASVYIVIVYLYPVLVVVGSSMLGHRVTAGVWVALAVVMSGIVLTVPELFGGVGEISVLGVVLTLVQAVLMAAFMIVNSKVMPGHIDGTVSAAWNCLGALVLMTPLAFGSGFHAPETRTVVLEVLLFGLVPTVIANVCFFRALRHIAPGVVAMIMTMEVALAIFWSWLFLGESVEAIKMVGAAVVIAGVLIAQWVNLRGGRTAPVTLPAP